MAQKSNVKMQPAEADVTRAQLFNDQDTRRIAAMVGESAMPRFLDSVAKLDSSYVRGEIGMADWSKGVMRLAADAVLPPGQSSEKLKKALDGMSDNTSPALSALRVVMASGQHTKVLDVFKIVDLLRPEVIARKCGIAKEDAKELLEMRLPVSSIVELVEKAKVWNGQLEAGAIKQGEWDEKIGRAIFELAPDYAPYDALLLRDKLMEIKPVDTNTAIYKKVR